MPRAVSLANWDADYKRAIRKTAVLEHEGEVGYVCVGSRETKDYHGVRYLHTEVTFTCHGSDGRSFQTTYFVFKTNDMEADDWRPLFEKPPIGCVVCESMQRMRQAIRLQLLELNWQYDNLVLVGLALVSHLEWLFDCGYWAEVLLTNFLRNNPQRMGWCGDNMMVMEYPESNPITTCVSCGILAPGRMVMPRDSGKHCDSDLAFMTLFDQRDKMFGLW